MLLLIYTFWNQSGMLFFVFDKYFSVVWFCLLFPFSKKSNVVKSCYSFERCLYIDLYTIYKYFLSYRSKFPFGRKNKRNHKKKFLFSSVFLAIVSRFSVSFSIFFIILWLGCLVVEISKFYLAIRLMHRDAKI